MVSQIVLQKAPTADVTLGFGPDSTFKLTQQPTKALSNGEVKVKVLLLSNDPAQRGWISANQNPARTYRPPVKEGEIVSALGLGEVLESKSEKFNVGDKVVGSLGWATEAVVHESAIFNKIDELNGLPLTTYLSAVGMTGLTAYFGLTEVCKLQEGQSILISAASGATGSMAVQIAKHVLKASKVIGIAGSEEKCNWVKSLGADYCANYREPGWKKKLSEYIGGDYVDCYFDNVGGDMLSFALRHVKLFGAVAACGAIAGYNDPSKLAVAGWSEIITNRLRVQGFIVMDFAAKYPQAVSALVAGIKAGHIKVTEGTSVVDLSGESNPIEKVPETWYSLFTEKKPLGKLVTKI